MHQAGDERGGGEMLSAEDLPVRLEAGWPLDDSGRDLCCPPPAPPTKETLEEMLNKHYPNRTCMWDGTAPFCDGKCPSDLRDGQYPSKDGKAMPAGFGKPCVTGMKVYCCRFGPY
jgi:hypothetical protein